MTSHAPRDAAELAALLRSRPGRVRIVGGGSRQHRIADAGDAVRVRLDRLATIARLDAPDQTCSVDSGVGRAELDAALAAVGLELPCPGGGTLGGLFASDPVGAASHGGGSPRSLLLGCDAVLADGTTFKSGARVVKSVAGFDVHKLLVGSQGRLFVATRLHLRCKPRPRAEEWFARDGLDAAAAVALVRDLRAVATAPAALQLVRADDGSITVRGRFAGRASFVSAVLRQRSLPAVSPCWQDHVDAPPAGEVLAGQALASALPTLLHAAPPGTPLLWHGGGRFEVALATATGSDALLRTLTTANIAACIVHGAPSRRGLGTTLDPGQLQLAANLHRAFDPHGILV